MSRAHSVLTRLEGNMVYAVGYGYTHACACVWLKVYYSTQVATLTAPSPTSPDPVGNMLLLYLILYSTFSMPVLLDTDVGSQERYGKTSPAEAVAVRTTPLDQGHSSWGRYTTPFRVIQMAYIIQIYK